MGGHKIPISPHQLYARLGAPPLVAHHRRTLDLCGSGRLVAGRRPNSWDCHGYAAKPADYLIGFMAAIKRSAVQHFYDGASS